MEITPCGGEGDRACCNGAGEYSNDGLACDSGLVQIPGCDESTSNCWCPIGLIRSGGTCVAPGPCGGKGQRGCCIGTLEYSNDGGVCDSGMTVVNGCAGDCTCGGTTAIGESATQSCIVVETIPEPDINATPTAGLPAGPLCPPAPALCGYADLHIHMFGNLGHGGAVIAGAPYDPDGGVNRALAQDYGSPRVLVDHNGDVVHQVDGSAGLPACPLYMLASPIGNLCQGEYLFHGDHTPFDTTTYGGTNDASASNFGAPSFNGWPQWTSTIHQQAYYKWLERAWRGGLRLMVMQAVTNETLCKTGTRLQRFDGTNPTDCTNSQVEIDAQIDAAKAFETWLDAQSGGTGNGWFRIVTTPQEATSVIHDGKLAVVLGIEVDNLFNCHFGADAGAAHEATVFPFEPTMNPPATIPACTPEFIQQQVKRYHDMGVRHVFPIHNFDNAFGGTATWQDSINVGNVVGEGEFYATENCRPANYGFWLDKGDEGFEVLLLNALGFNLPDPPDYPSGAGGAWASCNQKGLTRLGQTLINALMDDGMIIDIDHMSRQSVDATLNLAANRKYAGIAASHVQLFDRYTQDYADNFGRHERMRTAEQLAGIKTLGGMISVMLKDDVQDTAKGYCLPNAVCFGGALPGQEGGRFTLPYNGPTNNYGLNNDCRYSTTEWAQLYMYGVDTMGGPVSLGSDFNGVAGHVGPRFGSAACGGSGVERSAQEKARSRLVYPFELPGFGVFDKQVSGQRVFDFNTSGLAHIGLYPDLIADLRNVGITDSQLVPLFSSAQAYINMWSAAADEPPVITSGNSATFKVGSAGSFTVTATGSPPPTFSETSALPAGVTLSAAGVLSGMPAPGTGGVYQLMIIASNGITPNNTQSFTLNVGDFALSASPQSQTIRPGHDGIFAVATGALGGLTGDVDLTCGGGPPNATCTIASPVTVGATATSTIDLPNRKNQKGTFVVTFTGTLGSITHAVDVCLTVQMARCSDLGPALAAVDPVCDHATQRKQFVKDAKQALKDAGIRGDCKMVAMEKLVKESTCGLPNAVVCCGKKPNGKPLGLIARKGDCPRGTQSCSANGFKNVLEGMCATTTTTTTSTTTTTTLGQGCRVPGDCADQPCQTKACVNAECVYTSVVDGVTPNSLCATRCCSGVCCAASATTCNLADLCCVPNCAGRACGPDGCGRGGTCGTCPEGDSCNTDGQCATTSTTTASTTTTTTIDQGCRGSGDCADQPCQTKACVHHECVYTPVVDGVAPNSLCASRCCSGACCPAEATVCNQADLCCVPNCAGRACGPDGCGRGGTCGTCPAGEACNADGQCG